jgi:hypothetical protein
MGLLEWQNLIFILPMATAILYVVLMAAGISMGEHGDLDVDHDISFDQDLEVDHDLGIEHDVDGGHALGDAHAPDAAGAAHAHHPHLLGKALSFLGVGRVPLSILMISICLIWGAVGLVLNVVLGTDTMWRVVGFTALAAAVGTRLVAEGLAAVLPGEETYYTPKEQLVGEVGEVLYEVTPTSGTVRLCDSSGNLLDLDCRTWGDERIPAGARVVLQEYNASADWFAVRSQV